MALFKKRKSTKEKLAEKKKEKAQKEQGKLKARSVKDLTREVKANKKIESRDAARKANKAAGDRIDSIINFFKPKPKPKRRPPQGGSGGPTVKRRPPQSGSGGPKLGPDEGRVVGTAKRRPPQSGSGGATVKRRPPQSGSGPRTGSKELPTGRGSTKTLMPKTYTIKSGDTLSDIAKKMNTTVAMLKAANNIKDANKIRAGAKLKLYRDANKPTTKPKDTRPRTIAQAQKMGKKYFFDKNGKRKAAVTAEQLKKSGLTLAQWLKKK